MSSLDEFAKTKLAALEAAHLRRTLAETAREDGIWVTRTGGGCCRSPATIISI